MKFTRQNTLYSYVYSIVLLTIQLAGCTLAADEPTEISCVQCDDGGTSKCNTNVVQQTFDVCKNSETVTYEKCFTKIDSKGIVIRGCLANGDTSCTEANNCIASGSKTNNQIICKTCVGTDENCSQSDMDLNDVKYNKICAEGITKCIVKVNSKKVERACATEDDIKQCTDANTCKTCDTINCNAGIFPDKRIQCYQCNDSKCVDVVANSVVTKPCANYDEKDECYTRAESESKMIRGCKSDANDNQCLSTAAECAFCSTNNCNKLNYKYDQVLQCYQCSGDILDNTDCYKEQTSKDFKNCTKQLLYNDTEYCYTNVADNKIERGCLHDSNDITLEKCNKGGDGIECSACTQDNGCNSKEVSTEFTCIVCRSDLDKSCWNNADTIVGIKCRTNDSSAKDGCFHGIWNGIAIRGCMIDASELVQETCKDNKNDQCHVCNSSNCNKNKSSGAVKMSLHFGLVSIIFLILWNFK